LTRKRKASIIINKWKLINEHIILDVLINNITLNNELHMIGRERGEITMANVSIVMGSDSDMPVMAQAAEILEKLGVEFEMTVISAHREPDIFFEYAKTAEARGIKVIIAGAGKAAHLPGMCAALFPMPVIGIPMKTSDLGGVDSLYSIVQMPSGIPVATVAINGGTNAGILAAKILAVGDAELLARLKDYSESLKNDVVKKAEKLEKIGYREYLSQMK
jgi:5-(carboxyamino)imidazole ribonucleotide mutase